MNPPPPQRLLRISAVLTMLGLGLMLWSIFQPRAMPVVIAMSFGQGIGTLAFAMFGWVVLRDLRRTRALARRALARGVTLDATAEPRPEPQRAVPAPAPGPAAAPPDAEKAKRS